MFSKLQSRPLALRVMGRGDLREILRIEADSFRHPWSEQDFVEHMENPNSVALIVERNGLIVGYEVFGIHPPWIQLHSCVIRREFRRQGIGSQIVACLLRQVADGEGAGVLAKIPERSVAAQLFFRKSGFRAVKIIHAYLPGEQNVYVMQYGLTESTIPASAFETPEDELIPVWDVKHG